MRTWFPVKIVLSLLAVLGGVNCAGNEATPQAFEAETCPAKADSCPAECVLAEAYLLDIERECREKRVLGCQGPAAGVDDDFPCAKRISDDTLWFGPSSVFDPDLFVECSQAERDQSVDATVGCAD